uniref:Uncharacterized protein n=1 Tax=Anguilla anguilla TaxID=7936 RepID=A0A0E9R1Q7_ANGAN
MPLVRTGQVTPMTQQAQ